MKLPRLAEPDRERALELLASIIHPRNQLHDGGYHLPTTLPTQDLAWLARHGLDPRRVTTHRHDALVKALLGARRRLTLAHGARRLLESLGTGRPRGVFLEAALLANTLPSHSHRGELCGVCGLSGQVEWCAAERFFLWHEAGSGIPGDLEWAVCAIEPPEWSGAPAEVGRAILQHALLAIDALPATAAAGKAVEAVARLGFSRPAARSLVETLAFGGVLEAPPHRGLATGFVSFLDRDRRPSTRVEWDAPLGFWRGSNGVTWSNAKRLFGLDRRSRAPALPPIPTLTARRPRPAARAKARPRRPARPGDVWAVRVRDDAWPFVYVWQTKLLGGRLAARVEFVGLSEQPPTEAPPTLTPRGRRDGRWQQWAFSLEKTTGALLVAEGAAAPETSEPAPDRLPVGGAKDLAHLADWCFPELRR